MALSGILNPAPPVGSTPQRSLVAAAPTRAGAWGAEPRPVRGAGVVTGFLYA